MSVPGKGWLKRVPELPALLGFALSSLLGINATILPPTNSRRSAGSDDNTINGFCRSTFSLLISFFSKSKSFCRIHGANASGVRLTLAHWGNCTVCLDMTLPWAFQWTFNAVEDGRNLGGMLVKSFSVGKTHSVSQVTFLFWTRPKGDVRHISNQPVVRENSLQIHASTWRCTEAMQCQHASECD